MDRNDLRTTRDLALATYVKMHRLEVVKAVRTGKHYFEFMFRDPDRKFDDLALAFANSECQRFDNEMRSLKKLCMRNTDYR